MIKDDHYDVIKSDILLDFHWDVIKSIMIL